MRMITEPAVSEDTLARFEVQAEDGPQLTCLACGEPAGPVDEGDSLLALARMADEHECGIC
jgi:hypothetical protein